MEGDIGERPQWDTEAATRLLGKTVLVGLTYVDADDNEIRHVQKHGTIVEVDGSSGIGIETGDPELYWLPPHLEAFEPAEPGEYRLRSTGEVLVDPDFVSIWTVNAAEGRGHPDSLEAGFKPPD